MLSSGFLFLTRDTNILFFPPEDSGSLMHYVEGLKQHMSFFIAGALYFRPGVPGPVGIH